MILIGTSGYSYEDWIGNFYPEGTKKDKFLEFYSNKFRAVEINFTYYQLPSLKVMEGLTKKSEGKVEFVIKANKVFTHRKEENLSDYADKFKYSLAPLQEKKVLGALLFQFPYSFHAKKENYDHIQIIRENFKDHEIVMEFRSKFWANENIYKFLNALKIGFVNVDEPELPNLMPRTDEVTSDIGYVRFHGRNKANWWSGDNKSRYDYLYKKEELASWIPAIKKISKLTKKTFVFTNNHWQAKAVKNAKMIMEMLAY